MLPLPRGAVWQLLFLFCAALYINGVRSEGRVVCYYTNWSVYRPGTAKFNPQNINPYLCTHLIYAFGGFTKDNQMKPFDKYQDIEQGGYAKFTGLKTYNKQLKTMIAIGGWNEASSRFSPLVANPERRQKFIKNMLKFLRQNHFDGIDLDWEYPAHREGGKARDRDNYAQFVQELRAEFEREAEKTGRPRLLVTMAVPAGIEYIEKGYDIPKLNKYLDWFNVLTYDFHSSHEPSVNHHAPLYSLEEESEYNYDSELNIDYSIKFYLNAGADKDKLVLGIPTYGRSYTLINEESTEIGAPAEAPGDQGDATREKGYLAYYEICQNLKEDPEWTVVQPNPNAMGPYAYRRNQWVGYDDEAIVRKKAQYVVDNGLGGIMFWAIDNDDFRGTCSGKPYPLIEAAKDAMLEALGLGINEVSKPSAPQKPSRSRSRENSSSTRNRITTSEQKLTYAERKGSSKRTQTVQENTRNKQQSTTAAPLNIKLTEVEGSSLYIGGRTTTPPPPTTPDPGTDFKCEEEGFFQHPRDCKKYYWCLDSGPSGLGIVAHMFTCPSGLYFNPAADSCDFARNVPCKTKKSTTAAPVTSAPTTTTTARPTSSVNRLTATPTRTSFYRTTSTTTTTTTEAPEEEETEYEEDEDNVPSPFAKQKGSTDKEAEEDPKVIKELIELIRKVGGIEELEKHLLRQDDGTIAIKENSSSSSSSLVATTPSSISKSLYEKVLSKPNALNSFRNRFTSTSSFRNTQTKTEIKALDETKEEVDKEESDEIDNKSSGASAGYSKYSSVVRGNGRQGPQNEGIEKLTEFEGFHKEKKQYTTINRNRVNKKIEEEDEEEESVIAKSQVESHEDDEEVTVAKTTKRPSSNTPSYSTIRRTRPSTTTEATEETEEREEEKEVNERKSYTSLNRNRGRGTTTTEIPDVTDATAGSTRYKYLERTRPTRPTTESSNKLHDEEDDDPNEDKLEEHENTVQLKANENTRETQQQQKDITTNTQRAYASIGRRTTTTATPETETTTIVAKIVTTTTTTATPTTSTTETPITTTSTPLTNIETTNIPITTTTNPITLSTTTTSTTTTTLPNGEEVLESLTTTPNPNEINTDTESLSLSLNVNSLITESKTEIPSTSPTTESGLDTKKQEIDSYNTETTTEANDIIPKTEVLTEEVNLVSKQRNKTLYTTRGRTTTTPPQTTTTTTDTDIETTTSPTNSKKPLGVRRQQLLLNRSSQTKTTTIISPTTELPPTPTTDSVNNDFLGTVSSPRPFGFPKRRTRPTASASVSTTTTTTNAEDIIKPNEESLVTKQKTTKLNAAVNTQAQKVSSFNTIHSQTTATQLETETSSQQEHVNNNTTEKESEVKTSTEHIYDQDTNVEHIKKHVVVQVDGFEGNNHKHVVNTVDSFSNINHNNSAPKLRTHTIVEEVDDDDDKGPHRSYSWRDARRPTKPTPKKKKLIVTEITTEERVKQRISPDHVAIVNVVENNEKDLRFNRKEENVDKFSGKYRGKSLESSTEDNNLQNNQVVENSEDEEGRAFRTYTTINRRRYQNQKTTGIGEDETSVNEYQATKVVKSGGIEEDEDVSNTKSTTSFTRSQLNRDTKTEKDADSNNEELVKSKTKYTTLNRGHVVKTEENSENSGSQSGHIHDNVDSEDTSLKTKFKYTTITRGQSEKTETNVADSDLHQSVDTEENSEKSNSQTTQSEGDNALNLKTSFKYTTITRGQHTQTGDDSLLKTKDDSANDVYNEQDTTQVSNLETKFQYASITRGEATNTKDESSTEINKESERESSQIKHTVEANEDDSQGSNLKTNFKYTTITRGQTSKTEGTSETDSKTENTDLENKTGSNDNDLLTTRFKYTQITRGQSSKGTDNQEANNDNNETTTKFKYTKVTRGHDNQKSTEEDSENSKTSKTVQSTQENSHADETGKKIYTTITRNRGSIKNSQETENEAENKDTVNGIRTSTIYVSNTENIPYKAIVRGSDGVHLTEEDLSGFIKSSGDSTTTTTKETSQTTYQTISRGGFNHQLEDTELQHDSKIHEMEAMSLTHQQKEETEQLQNNVEEEQELTAEIEEEKSLDTEVELATTESSTTTEEPTTTTSTVQPKSEEESTTQEPLHSTEELSSTTTKEVTTETIATDSVTKRIPFRNRPSTTSTTSTTAEPTTRRSLFRNRGKTTTEAAEGSTEESATEENSTRRTLYRARTTTTAEDEEDSTTESPRRRTVLRRRPTSPTTTTEASLVQETHAENETDISKTAKTNVESSGNSQTTSFRRRTVLRRKPTTIEHTVIEDDEAQQKFDRESLIRTASETLVDDTSSTSHQTLNRGSYRPSEKGDLSSLLALDLAKKYGNKSQQSFGNAKRRRPISTTSTEVETEEKTEESLSNSNNESSLTLENSSSKTQLKGDNEIITETTSTQTLSRGSYRPSEKGDLSSLLALDLAKKHGNQSQQTFGQGSRRKTFVRTNRTESEEHEVVSNQGSTLSTDSEGFNGRRRTIIRKRIQISKPIIETNYSEENKTQHLNSETEVKETLTVDSAASDSLKDLSHSFNSSDAEVNKINSEISETKNSTSTTQLKGDQEIITETTSTQTLTRGSYRPSEKGDLSSLLALDLAKKQGSQSQKTFGNGSRRKTLVRTNVAGSEEEVARRHRLNGATTSEESSSTTGFEGVNGRRRTIIRKRIQSSKLGSETELSEKSQEDKSDTNAAALVKDSDISVTEIKETVSTNNGSSTILEDNSHSSNTEANTINSENTSSETKLKGDNQQIVTETLSTQTLTRGSYRPSEKGDLSSLLALDLAKKQGSQSQQRNFGIGSRRKTLVRTEETGSGEDATVRHSVSGASNEQTSSSTDSVGANGRRRTIIRKRIQTSKTTIGSDNSQDSGTNLKDSTNSETEVKETLSNTSDNTSSSIYSSNGISKTVSQLSETEEAKQNLAQTNSNSSDNSESNLTDQHSSDKIHLNAVNNQNRKYGFANKRITENRASQNSKTENEDSSIQTHDTEDANSQHDQNSVDNNISTSAGSKFQSRNSLSSQTQENSRKSSFSSRRGTFNTRLQNNRGKTEEVETLEDGTKRIKTTHVESVNNGDSIKTIKRIKTKTIVKQAPEYEYEIEDDQVSTTTRRTISRNRGSVRFQSNDLSSLLALDFASKSSRKVEGERTGVKSRRKLIRKPDIVTEEEEVEEYEEDLPTRPPRPSTTTQAAEPTSRRTRPTRPLRTTTTTTTTTRAPKIVEEKTEEEEVEENIVSTTRRNFAFKRPTSTTRFTTTTSAPFTTETEEEVEESTTRHNVGFRRPTSIRRTQTTTTEKPIKVNVIQENETVVEKTKSTIQNRFKFKQPSRTTTEKPNTTSTTTEDSTTTTTEEPTTTSTTTEDSTTTSTTTEEPTTESVPTTEESSLDLSSITEKTTTTEYVTSPSDTTTPLSSTALQEESTTESVINLDSLDVLKNQLSNAVRKLKTDTNTAEVVQKVTETEVSDAFEMKTKITSGVDINLPIYHRRKYYQYYKDSPIVYVNPITIAPNTKAQTNVDIAQQIHDVFNVSNDHLLDPESSSETEALLAMEQAQEINSELEVLDESDVKEVDNSRNRDKINEEILRNGLEVNEETNRRGKAFKTYRKLTTDISKEEAINGGTQTTIADSPHVKITVLAKESLRTTALPRNLLSSTTSKPDVTTLTEETELTESFLAEEPEKTTTRPKFSRPTKIPLRTTTKETEISTTEEHEETTAKAKFSRARPSRLPFITTTKNFKGTEISTEEKDDETTSVTEKIQKTSARTKFSKSKETESSTANKFSKTRPTRFPITSTTEKVEVTESSTIYEEKEIQTTLRSTLLRARPTRLPITFTTETSTTENSETTISTTDVEDSESTTLGSLAERQETGEVEVTESSTIDEEKELQTTLRSTLASTTENSESIISTTVVEDSESTTLGSLAERQETGESESETSVTEKIDTDIISTTVKNLETAKSDSEEQSEVDNKDKENSEMNLKTDTNEEIEEISTTKSTEVKEEAEIKADVEYDKENSVTISPQEQSEVTEDLTAEIEDIESESIAETSSSENSLIESSTTLIETFTEATTEPSALKPGLETSSPANEELTTVTISSTESTTVNGRPTRKPFHLRNRTGSTTEASVVLSTESAYDLVTESSEDKAASKPLIRVNRPLIKSTTTKLPNTDESLTKTQENSSTKRTFNRLNRTRTFTSKATKEEKVVAEEGDNDENGLISEEPKTESVTRKSFLLASRSKDVLNRPTPNRLIRYRTTTPKPKDVDEDTDEKDEIENVDDSQEEIIQTSTRRIFGNSPTRRKFGGINRLGVSTTEASPEDENDEKDEENPIEEEQEFTTKRILASRKPYTGLNRLSTSRTFTTEVSIDDATTENSSQEPLVEEEISTERTLPSRRQFGGLNRSTTTTTEVALDDNKTESSAEKSLDQEEVSTKRTLPSRRPFGGLNRSTTTATEVALDDNTTKSSAEKSLDQEEVATKSILPSRRPFGGLNRSTTTTTEVALDDNTTESSAEKSLDQEEVSTKRTLPSRRPFGGLNRSTTTTTEDALDDNTTESSAEKSLEQEEVSTKRTLPSRRPFSGLNRSTTTTTEDPVDDNTTESSAEKSLDQEEVATKRTLPSRRPYGGLNRSTTTTTEAASDDYTTESSSETSLEQEDTSTKRTLPSRRPFGGLNRSTTTTTEAVSNDNTTESSSETSLEPEDTSTKRTLPSRRPFAGLNRSTTETSLEQETSSLETVAKSEEELESSEITENTSEESETISETTSQEEHPMETTTSLPSKESSTPRRRVIIKKRIRLPTTTTAAPNAEETEDSTHETLETEAVTKLSPTESTVGSSPTRRSFTRPVSTTTQATLEESSATSTTESVQSATTKRLLLPTNRPRGLFIRTTTRAPEIKETSDDDLNQEEVTSEEPQTLKDSTTRRTFNRLNRVQSSTRTPIKESENISNDSSTKRTFTRLNRFKSTTETSTPNETQTDDEKELEEHVEVSTRRNLPSFSQRQRVNFNRKTQTETSTQRTSVNINRNLYNNRNNENNEDESDDEEEKEETSSRRTFGTFRQQRINSNSQLQTETKPSLKPFNLNRPQFKRPLPRKPLDNQAEDFSREEDKENIDSDNEESDDEEEYTDDEEEESLADNKDQLASQELASKEPSSSLIYLRNRVRLGQPQDIDSQQGLVNDRLKNLLTTRAKTQTAIDLTETSKISDETEDHNEEVAITNDTNTNSVLNRYGTNRSNSTVANYLNRVKTNLSQTTTNQTSSHIKYIKDNHENDNNEEVDNDDDEEEEDNDNNNNSNKSNVNDNNVIKGNDNDSKRRFQKYQFQRRTTTTSTTTTTTERPVEAIEENNDEEDDVEVEVVTKAQVNDNEREISTNISETTAPTTESPSSPATPVARRIRVLKLKRPVVSNITSAIDSSVTNFNASHTETQNIDKLSSVSEVDEQLVKTHTLTDTETQTDIPIQTSPTPKRFRKVIRKLIRPVNRTAEIVKEDNAAEAETIIKHDNEVTTSNTATSTFSQRRQNITRFGSNRSTKISLSNQKSHSEEIDEEEDSEEKTEERTPSAVLNRGRNKFTLPSGISTTTRTSLYGTANRNRYANRPQSSQTTEETKTATEDEEENEEETEEDEEDVKETTVATDSKNTAGSIYTSSSGFRFSRPSSTTPAPLLSKEQVEEDNTEDSTDAQQDTTTQEQVKESSSSKLLDLQKLRNKVRIDSSKQQDVGLLSDRFKTTKSEDEEEQIDDPLLRLRNKVKQDSAKGNQDDGVLSNRFKTTKSDDDAEEQEQTDDPLLKLRNKVKQDLAKGNQEEGVLSNRFKTTKTEKEEEDESDDPLLKLRNKVKQDLAKGSQEEGIVSFKLKKLLETKSSTSTLNYKVDDNENDSVAAQDSLNLQKIRDKVQTNLAKGEQDEGVVSSRLKKLLAERTSNTDTNSVEEFSKETTESSGDHDLIEQTKPFTPRRPFVPNNRAQLTKVETDGSSQEQLESSTSTPKVRPTFRRKLVAKRPYTPTKPPLSALATTTVKIPSTAGKKKYVRRKFGRFHPFNAVNRNTGEGYIRKDPRGNLLPGADRFKVEGSAGGHSGEGEDYEEYDEEGEEEEEQVEEEVNKPAQPDKPLLAIKPVIARPPGLFNRPHTNILKKPPTQSKEQGSGETENEDEEDEDEEEEDTEDEVADEEEEKNEEEEDSSAVKQTDTPIINRPSYKPKDNRIPPGARPNLNSNKPFTPSRLANTPNRPRGSAPTTTPSYGGNRFSSTSRNGNKPRVINRPPGVAAPNLTLKPVAKDFERTTVLIPTKPAPFINPNTHAYERKYSGPSTEATLDQNHDNNPLIEDLNIEALNARNKKIFETHSKKHTNSLKQKVLIPFGNLNENTQQQHQEHSNTENENDEGYQSSVNDGYITTTTTTNTLQATTQDNTLLGTHNTEDENLSNVINLNEISSQDGSPTTPPPSTTLLHIFTLSDDEHTTRNPLDDANLVVTRHGEKAKPKHKVVEINRIVEVNSKEEKLRRKSKANTIRTVEGSQTFKVESLPHVEQLGEISVVKYVHQVEGSDITIEGRSTVTDYTPTEPTLAKVSQPVRNSYPQGNEQMDERNGKALVPEVIREAVESSTISLEGLFENARKGKVLNTIDDVAFTQHQQQQETSTESFKAATESSTISTVETTTESSNNKQVDTATESFNILKSIAFDIAKINLEPNSGEIETSNKSLESTSSTTTTTSESSSTTSSSAAQSQSSSLPRLSTTLAPETLQVESSTVASEEMKATTVAAALFPQYLRTPTTANINGLTVTRRPVLSVRRRLINTPTAAAITTTSAAAATATSAAATQQSTTPAFTTSQVSSSTGNDEYITTSKFKRLRTNRPPTSNSASVDITTDTTATSIKASNRLKKKSSDTLANDLKLASSSLASASSADNDITAKQTTKYPSSQQSSAALRRKFQSRRLTTTLASTTNSDGSATDAPRTQNPLFKRRYSLTTFSPPAVKTVLPPRAAATTLRTSIDSLTTTVYVDGSENDEATDQVAKSSIHTSRFNQITGRLHIDDDDDEELVEGVAADTGRHVVNTVKAITTLPVATATRQPTSRFLQQQQQQQQTNYNFEDVITRRMDGTGPIAKYTTTTSTTTTTTAAPVIKKRKMIIKRRPQKATPSSVETPAVSRRKPHKYQEPFERINAGNKSKAAIKSSSSQPGRTYRPNLDYDYYDDEDVRFVGNRSDNQLKVILHGGGIIECLDQGNFPHPLSCRKFISCAKFETGGVVGWEYTCPKGLSYDPVGGMCNWAAGLGCKE